MSNTTNRLIAEPIAHESLIDRFPRQPLPTGEFVQCRVEINESNLNTRRK